MDGALSTRDVAAASGYSVQQVRDLEALGVIPPARRAPNGYRVFGNVHVHALSAYRALAVAVGPVIARDTMRDLPQQPLDEAVARLSPSTSDSPVNATTPSLPCAPSASWRARRMSTTRP